MTCAEVREMLPAAVGDDDSLAVRRHLARCPGCRAEAAMYEALRGSFGELRSMSAEPPTGLLASLQAIPANARRLDGVMTHVARNRKAYAGGAAAMVATGAVGLLLRSRSRRYAPA